MATIAHLIGVVGTSPQTAFWPTGNEECPCIHPFTDMPPSGSGMDLGSHRPPYSAPSCNWTRQDGICFPASYGSGNCLQHDLQPNTSPECRTVAALRPGWCDTLWCYVDPANCNRPNQPTGYFADATWNGEPLSYSYETCGYVDTYATSQVQTILAHAAKQANGKLRVAFPNADIYSVKLLTTSDGVGGTNRSGAIPTMMDTLFRANDIAWEEVRGRTGKTLSSRTTSTARTHRHNACSMGG